MTRYSEFYKARDIVTHILFQDFVGPVYEDECLAELPLHYYIMGKLYPQSNSIEALDLARNPFLENEVETYDASISLSNQNNPSSMGITVTLKPGVSQIKISGKYAFYQQIPFEKAKDFGVDSSRWEKLKQTPEDLWKRKIFSYSEIIKFTGKRVEYKSLEENLQLQVYTHLLMNSGERVITIVIINENQPENSDLQTTSALCAFQPIIHIEGIEKNPIFTL